MKTILLNDSVLDTLSSASGVSLYCQIEKHFNNSQKVFIDLRGADAMSSSFFNSSFGSLIEKYGYQRVKESLKFINATKTQVSILSYLFNSYKDYSY